jgi:hypothetical protein
MMNQPLRRVDPLGRSATPARQRNSRALGDLDRRIPCRSAVANRLVVDKLWISNDARRLTHQTANVFLRHTDTDAGEPFTEDVAFVQLISQTALPRITSSSCCMRARAVSSSCL